MSSTRGRIEQRDHARMRQDAKVQARVGDQVRATDFRSEFYGRVGTIVAITEYVEHGCGRGACLKVKFPQAGSKRGGTEGTGAQWFAWVGPAPEQAPEQAS